jgi:hemoglobin
MIKDIETREDIDRLMRTFYARALSDEIIGYIFTDVARLDLDRHLPIIGDFRESLLLGTGVYQVHGRNPLLVHRDLHEKSALREEHFRRWLELFETCVNEDFSGETADYAILRAQMIATRFRSALGVTG